EETLDRSILAKAAMKGVERNVRLQLPQPFGNVVADIHLSDPVAGAAQSLGTTLARDERNRALVGKPAHENGDMLGHLLVSPIKVSRSPGTAAAHWVMLPAPRQTT